MRKAKMQKTGYNIVVRKKKIGKNMRMSLQLYIQGSIYVHENIYGRKYTR